MKLYHTTGIVVFSLVSSAAIAEPFTYQGQLNEAGQLADGIYDLRFELYDTAVAGTQIGGTIAFENLIVTDGIFTVDLDFGVGAFSADARFLDIEVRPGASGGIFTPLTPRTPINPTPKAQHAIVADQLSNPIWNQSGSVINGGDGTDRLILNRGFFITGSEYFGVHADTTGFVGMYVSGPENSLPFYGYSVNNKVSAYTYFSENSQSWNVVGASGIGLTLDASNNLEVTSDVIADDFVYSNPKLNYYSVSGNSFHSASNDPFFASSGTGGAYIANPGSGYLVAPVNLPHGATVTRMRVYCDDTSAGGSFSTTLQYQTHGGGSFFGVASVDTTGFNSNNLALFDDANHTVDNNLRHYHIRVFSSNWSGSLSMRIDSVVIEYTTEQAD